MTRLFIVNIKALNLSQAETHGYVAIGFSPNGGMAGADIFLAWVHNNGTIVGKVVTKKFIVKTALKHLIMLIILGLLC